MSDHRPPPAPPLTSYEVRWFFDPDDSRLPAVRQWFETATPFPRADDVAPPEFRGRAGGQPDAYLLLPGRDDMGIKWREGMLQIKGLVVRHGTTVFGERHRGCVERWIKWSFAGLPEPWRAFFRPGRECGPRVVPVAKERALRRLYLNTFTAEVIEVGANRAVGRGMNVELTRLTLADGTFWSLGLEAFPDDATMPGAFADAAARLLDSLADVELDEACSLSYPAWLASRLSGEVSPTR